MTIQMAERPNTTPIGQDRETLTFKALLYLNVPVHAQVCRRFCMVYIPLFKLVQLGYLAITNIFAVNQIIRYNWVFAITKTPAITNIFSRTVVLRYSGVSLYIEKGLHNCFIPYHRIYSGQMGRLGVIQLNCTDRWEGSVEY